MAGLHISQAQLGQMRRHAEETAPLEACGLLGGTEFEVTRVVAVTNAAASPVRYRMEPEEQIRALFGFEEDGLQLLGIYHSHPNGPNGPSEMDLREADYPEAVQLIWFRDEEGWSYRAFRFEAGGAAEIPLQVETGGSGKE